MEDKDVNVFHTHLEIHPSTMLSVVSANIPLSNHNQSARNVFHAAQSKQAIGIYATSFNHRFDTMAYVQHYPQRPLVGTRLSQYTCSDYMPNGFNVVVAIMTYSGFNQEDSIMINKQSVERGLFNLSYYKSVTATAKEVSDTERVIFGNPMDYVNKGINIKGVKHANYSLLDENGFIKEGSIVSKGQKVVTIGMINVKEVYKKTTQGLFTEMVKETEYTDVSITTDNSVYGIVNKVFHSQKSVGNNSSVCKVRFLKIRKPEFGDKHASRHGQKGVIGMIIPEESMPFTKDGIKPDIIINPHAIPSRMTIGHLVECVFAKLCCFKGTIGDGSVFVPFDDKQVYKELGELGFDSCGNEMLYNGYTGQQIQTEIFIGPTFYFRLKHMVADKLNVRGHDRDKNELPKVMLTRQPTSGKRKGGGLRIGEMERDSVLSHGTSLFLKETMMERSDFYKWSVCRRCGIMAIYNPSKKNRIIKCKLCNKDDIVVVETPYAFKLLTQELEAMGISIRFNVENKLGMTINDDDIESSDEGQHIIYGGSYGNNFVDTADIPNVEEEEVEDTDEDDDQELPHTGNNVDEEYDTDEEKLDETDEEELDETDEEKLEETDEEELEETDEDEEELEETDEEDADTDEEELEVSDNSASSENNTINDEEINGGNKQDIKVINVDL
jgi:DNA-directed RNA polymerase beta subunit